MLGSRILLALIAVVCSAGFVFGDVTVKVTGNGTTRTEALEDATRQAVQLALEQLIITDRKIINDEVVRDETISTLNGFVKKRKILATRKSRGEVEVDVLITVSEQQVTNYIGDVSPGNNPRNNTQIDGSTLGSELERQRNARNAGTDAVLRLFRGFPVNAVEIKIESARLSKRNTNALEIVYTIQFSGPFRRQFETTVAALSSGKVKIARAEGYDYRFEDQPTSWSRSPFTWWAGGPISDHDQKTRYGNSYYVCFQNSKTATCYLLQDNVDLGIKYRDMVLYSPLALIAFKGLTSSGMELFCLPSLPRFVTRAQLNDSPTFPIQPFSGTPGSSNGLLIGVDKATLVSQVDISGIDLSELEELVPYAGIATYRGYPAGSTSGSNVDGLVIHDVSSGQLGDSCGP